jgi:GNAT superfamily N-acetyltransferase
MAEILIRKMAGQDRLDVAALIHFSTNHWYQAHGRGPIFGGGPETTEVFYDVYRELDGDCGVVAVEPASSRIVGSCFYHPRETHVSLGIMNVHPSYGGAGVARRLLAWIVDFADQQHRPLRLVSSALNLDSFSLYTRAGFVPRFIYQDMILRVPEGGMPSGATGRENIRDATLNDVPAIAALEQEVAGISRRQDYRYFIANRAGVWHMSVCQGAGCIEGFCASCSHPGGRAVGPGAARNAAVAASLLAAELDRHRGQTMLFLVPADSSELVAAAYSWGARNCELHFGQVRGSWQPMRGLVMPTFLPESA